MVDVYIWLNDELPKLSPEHMLADPSPNPDGSFISQFSIVDPDDRNCEHACQFRVYPNCIGSARTGSLPSRCYTVAEGEPVNRIHWRAMNGSAIGPAGEAKG